MSTRPRDKHGTEISTGDTVELVYGGDQHQMVVESIGESHGIPTVSGTVTVTHRAPAVKVAKRSARARSHSGGNAASPEIEGKKPSEPQDSTPVAKRAKS